MDKPEYFIEEGVRRFYDKDMNVIKETAFNRLFKCSYPKENVGEKKMIDKKAGESIEQAVCYELQNIVKKYGATYHSEHEAYAVLLEEAQEASEAQNFLASRLEFVWKAIRNNDIKTAGNNVGEIKEWALALAEEAVQCAAVCERFIETIKREEQNHE